jgi:hypothetical protein
MTEQNPFSFLDFTSEDVLEAEKVLKRKTRLDRDNRICVCGHPVARHETTFATYCKPSKMECPCKKVRPVLQVGDVRCFLRKTTGSGVFHALGLGLQTAVERGFAVTWLIDQKCDKCGVEGPISPVPVTSAGVPKEEATGYDVLICKKCRLEL